MVHEELIKEALDDMQVVDSTVILIRGNWSTKRVYVLNLFFREV